MPWTKFSTMIPVTPICAVSRANIFTGRYTRNLGGFWWHGTSGQSSVAGTAAYWDSAVGGADGGRNMLPFWLQNAGYHTGLVGKYLNLYPFARGDSYIPVGWNEWWAFLDDTTLGGAHAAHIGPAHFDYYANIDGATFGPFAGPQNSTTDPWTSTGSDASGRADGTTNYATDRINLRIRKLINGSAGGLREPFYIHAATYGVKQASPTVGPALRHKSPFSVTDPGRPASFNEADISDKPEWLREYVPSPLDGTATAALDAERVAKVRTSHSIDEALRDIVTALTARTTPGVSGTWMDRTMIVVTTEHSNAEGQHRLAKKGLPWECCITTPMFVHYPSSGDRWNFLLVIVDDALVDMWASMPYLSSLPTSTSTALVSTIDIAPTFLDAARASRHVTRRPDGQSFLPLLTGAMSESQWRQVALSEWTNAADNFPEVPSWRSVRTHTRRYTEIDALGVTSAAETELYRLDVDPDEMVNETNNAAYAGDKAALAAQLAMLQG